MAAKRYYYGNITKNILIAEDRWHTSYYNTETDQISGLMFFDLDLVTKYGNPSIFVVIDGKDYPCKLQKRELSEFSNEEKEALRIYDSHAVYSFECNYPQQHPGKTIQLRVEDVDGYVSVKSIVIPNYKPKLRVDSVHSSDKKISGKTEAGCAVTIQYGKKTYKTKAAKNGQFSVKVKSQKAGTPIVVSVVSQKGYTNRKKLKTVLGDSTVSVNNTVYRTSSSISITIKKPGQGDKLTVKAAGKTYTKKFKRDMAKQKVVIRLKKKPAAGSTVSVVLRDKFGKKKDLEKVMAYYGDTIKLGMSASNAVLTTWEEPVRKNDFGTGSLQWVFRSGNSYLYAYIKEGKVVAIQRWNY